MFQLVSYSVYFLSIISTTFWMGLWIMHILALTNAKLKLNKRSYTSAASKRKRKLNHLKEKYIPFIGSKLITKETTQNHNNTNNNNINNNNNNLDIICCDITAKSKLIQIDSNETHSNESIPEVDVRTKETSCELTNNDNCSPYEALIEFKTQSNELFKDFELPPSRQQEDQYENQKDFYKFNRNDFYYSNKIDELNSITSNNNHFNDNKNYFSYINLPLPGVSILKPLVGVDSNLHKNLETFFTMDYPTYELLFCVQEPEDAAILIVKNLFRIYPHIDAKLFIGGSRVGVNPKINNMQPAYEVAKYELLLVSDSGISMKKDTLLDMVAHMHDDIALVHQMPFVCDGRQGFQSVFEKVYFGTVHARAYLFADLMNINCPTGMSALMRKCLLDEVGGIKAFGQYLAEDFFFAKSFTDRGWKISISSQPAWQNSANSSDTLSTLNSRIQRWVKLRFAMVPQWTLLEPFSECMLLGLLGAISISFLWALDPFAIFLFHVLLWFLFDYMLLCTIQGGPLTFSHKDFIFAWLIRECTALLVFLKALTSPKVTWRSRSFKLKWGGYAEEIIT